MADSSFDIVSKLDLQEADNAVNQTSKEISQRYDFKGTDAEVHWDREHIVLTANSAERAQAMLDVLQSKMIKRGISLKHLDTGEAKPSGKLFNLEINLKQGIEQDTAKRITKLIRDDGPRAVKAAIEGDQIRVSSKSRDNLQAVIALLKAADFDTDLQFVNYR